MNAQQLYNILRQTEVFAGYQPSSVLIEYRSTLSSALAASEYDHDFEQR